MKAEQAAALRAAFDPKVVGKLPRITCGDCSKALGRVCPKHSKSKCQECGNYITGAHLHLDYVGHAAITDRLLQVDPEWTWDFQAVNQDGSPVILTAGLADPVAKVGIWIRLTVAGVTRPGFGEGKNFKEAIGDALRNAAMRFGVALDLWSKEDLHVDDDAAPGTGASSSPADSRVSTDGVGDRQPVAASSTGSEGTSAVPAGGALNDPVTAALVGELLRLSKEFGADVAAVQKSITKNREATAGYLSKHHAWLERQTATVKANLAEKEAAKAAEAKFPIPDKAKAA